MITLYLQWNLLLAVTFVIFRALSGGSLKVGQGILVLAVALPIFFRVLPSHSLPPLPHEVLAPLAEMEETLRPAISKVAPHAYSPPVETATPERIDWVGVAILAWVAATAAFAAWVALRAWRLRSVLRRAVGIRRLGRVRIVLSSEVTIPFSTRLGGDAWVVVPESLLARWKDLRIAIAHELQHHRQGDTHWAWWLEAMVILFSLYPFVHLWKRRIHELQELSCDEALIGHKLSSYEYGSCLVRVAETALEARPMWVGTAGMAAGFGSSTYIKSFLSRRIEMLAMDPKQKRPGRRLVLGTLALLSTVAAAYGADQLRTKSDPGAIGEGLITTEPAIQKIADTALDAALKRHKASLGFVVVSDPSTGKILAVANQDRMETQAQRSPHWALSLRVGPASLAKAIVTAAAVEKGVTTIDEVHNCENGKYEWGGKTYRDWKAFDKLSTRESLAHSSNICGIKVGQKLGAPALAQAFRDFGFGPEGSAVGFPESRAGELPRSDSDEPLYIATVSTGYNGIYTTPVELVQAIGAIANGGNLLKPQFGSGATSPRVVRRVLSEETSKKMREALQDTMIYGTAMKSASKLYKLAGKTATGYSHTHVGHDTLGGESNMASFVGFAPADSPRVVIYVVVENPTDLKGVHGAYHAAPVFKEVAEKTLQYLKVPAG